MVSSVLAQAILNQDAPDVLGAYKEGQQEVRQEKTRELAGQALSTGKIDPLLAELNPEIAFAIGEQIRARSAQDISDFLRDAQIAKAKLDAGDVQGAMQFTNQRIQAIENRGGDSSNSRAFAQTLSNSPENARQELNALLGSIEQTKGIKVGNRIVDPTTGKVIFEAEDKGLSDSERANLAIEREKIELRRMESEERKRQFEAKSGELKPGVQKILDKTQNDAVEAGARSRQLGLLASDLESAGDIGGGRGSSFSEFLKAQLGTQDDVSELRRRFNAIRSSEAIQNLPPGVASDKDIELALKGFPREDAPKQQLISFLRGSQKLADFQREYNQVKSELISETGSTRGLLKRLKERLPEALGASQTRSSETQGATVPQASGGIKFLGFE